MSEPELLIIRHPGQAPEEEMFATSRLGQSEHHLKQWDADFCLLLDSIHRHFAARVGAADFDCRQAECKLTAGEVDKRGRYDHWC